MLCMGDVGWGGGGGINYFTYIILSGQFTRRFKPPPQMIPSPLYYAIISSPLNKFLD